MTSFRLTKSIAINKEWLYISVLTASVFIVFSNTLGGTFLNWDDTLYIRENPLIKQPIGLESFRALLAFDYYISLVLFSFLAQYQIWGMDADAFQWVNIGLHAANVLLVYSISRSLFKNPTLAFFTALLFAIHPLRSETVGWLIQRKDLLYTFFVLLSIQTYFYLYKSKSFFALILLSLFAYLSHLCKAQALALPFLLLLCEFFRKHKLDHKSLALFYFVFFIQTSGSYISLVFITYVFIPCFYVIKPSVFSFFLENFLIKIEKFIDKKKRNKTIIVFFYLSYFLLFTYVPYIILASDIIKKRTNLFTVPTKKSLFQLILAAPIIIFGLNYYLFKNFVSILYVDMLGVYILFVFLCSLYLFDFKFFNLSRYLWGRLRTLFLFFFIFILILHLASELLDTSLEVHILEIEFLYIPILLIKGDIFLHYLYQRTRKAWMLILLVSGMFLTIFLLQNGLHNGSLLNIFEKVTYAAHSLNYYLIKFFYPFHLLAMHPYPDSISGLAEFYGLSVFIILPFFALTFMALFFLKNKSLKQHLMFAFLFFLICISLVLHIIPIEGKVIVADRYTYLAYFGLFFGITALFSYLYDMIPSGIIKYVFKFFVFCLFVLLSFQTYTRNKVWQNDYTFWGDVLKKSPDNHYAYYSIGLYFYETENYSKAIEHYNKAIEIHDADFEYYANRGATYVSLKNFNSALHDFDKAIGLHPGSHTSLYNRGALFRITGDLVAAKRDFEHALLIKPDYLKAQEGLEFVMRILDHSKDDGTYSQNKQASEYYNSVGIEWAKLNLFENALEAFEKAVATDTLSIYALKNRGNTYAALKMFDKAKADFYRVLEISPEDGGVYLNMGNVMHESGAIDSACRYWEAAKALGINGAEAAIERFCKP